MQLNDFTNEKIFDLNETIAAELFRETTYAWEVLPMISDFIRRIGPTLPADRFEQRGEDIWVAKSATVFDSAYIGGPCIVGNSTELKNVILFNKVEVPHYNYVGDSVLGFHAHMGAGSITSNVKADKKNVMIHCDGTHTETGLRKIGAILGDWVDVGCNSVLNPGSVVGPHTNIYPLSMIRGVVPAWHVYKDKDHVVEKIVEE